MHEQEGLGIGAFPGYVQKMQIYPVQGDFVLRESIETGFVSANGMAVTPLQADVVGNGHYATAELLAGNRFKRPEHATGTRLTRLDGRCDLLPTI